MPRVVVGRDAEVASIRDFVASISDGATALVLVGEAGVGKTTLWTAGIQEAEARGFRVLQARPAESETALSFSGVADLLGPVLDEVLVALPAPQRRALSRALALEDEEGPAPDRHTIGLALLGAVRELATGGPILLAIDDAQWLDQPSSAALTYGWRRLRSEQAGLVLSRRSRLESTLADEVRRSRPSDRFLDIEVGPLDEASLYSIVQDALGISLPRPLLAEVHEASGGNPFYALEMVRMLKRSGASVEAGQLLPVPDSLHELVHARLLALPADSREFLLGAAALSHPTVALVEQATDIPSEAGLQPALEARIVELEGDRIRFTHPLLNAEIYATADPFRRAEVHSRLADLVEDPEARGRHLAVSVTRPDADVADALEEAAHRAHERGAPRSAALLLDRACELTPSDQADDAHRRAVDAAYLHYESGDSPRAEAQLRGLLEKLGPGRSRARALTRLARVRAYATLGEAAELFLQAVAEAEGDAEILAIAHEGVSACRFHLYEGLTDAVEHAEIACALALELGDEALAAEALTTRWDVELVLGHEGASETAKRALALQAADDDRRLLGQPRFVHAAGFLWWTRALDQARTELIEILRRAAELGDESSTPLILAYLGQVECELGELDVALARARAAREAAQQSGQPTVVAHAIALESLAEAQRGNIDRARALAGEALRLVPATGGREAEFVARRALGQLELSLAAPDAACQALEPVVAFVRREAIAEPGVMAFVADMVEAEIERGRIEHAGELLDWYERHARRLGRASALAAASRCRGLLAAHEGDLERALHALEGALGWHAQVRIPLDRGRTLLARGMTLRRAKRRREARATLEEALAHFERIGAALWAGRARDELRRISGRAPSRDALTPAEERVAALVAEGKTNREVAAALFLSERTVEGHLSRVFGKFGIRHRAELAGALAARDTQGMGPSNTGGAPVSAKPVAP